MDERQLRFRVGVVVLAAAIITIILITLLGAWPSPFKPRYTVQVEFDTAPGVTIDTPVRKSGIQIGRVSDLELKESGRVLLTLKIDADYRLKQDQVCRISTGSMVTGDAVLEWVRSDGGTVVPTKFIGDGDYLQNGQVAADPFATITNLEDSVRDALGSIEGAGQEVELAARKINGVLGSKENELDALVDEMLLAVRNFNSVMGDVQDITSEGKLKAQLSQTMERLPVLAEKAETTLDDVKTTLGKFNSVAVRAERNLANLEDFTAPLGERGEEISQNLVESIRSVNDLLDNLAVLSKALNNKDGTLGQLINNPELYDRVNRTLIEIEKTVRRVEPIMNDVRVITDKVSRDPSQMGVKGILDRRPKGTEAKYPTGWPQTSRGSGQQRH